VRSTIDALEKRIALEAVRDTAGEALDHARARLAPLEAERAAAHSASETFDGALAKVYRDPAAARSRFEAGAREHGEGAAAAELRNHPERFGEIRGTQIGPVRSEERKQALQVASDLDRLGTDHLRGVRQTALTSEPYHTLKATVADLDQRVKRLDVELARGPGSATLRSKLERQLQSLRPEQRTTLRRSLPVPQRGLVAGAIATAVAASRAFAQEQGHER